jgi:hypothetical protein
MISDHIEKVVAEFRVKFDETFSFGDSDVNDGVEWLCTTLTTLIAEAKAEERERLTFVVANMREPLPSANDHREYVRGQRTMVEACRKHLLDVLNPTTP